MESEIDHLPADLVKDGDWICRRLGKRIMRRTISSPIGGKLNGTIGKGSEILIDLVDQLVAKFSTSL
jgi:hypothetical protein